MAVQDFSSDPPRTHLDAPEMADLVAPWRVMWKQTVPDIGHLTCYSAPRCIVHVMDYFAGGWDVYVPVSDTNSIKATIALLEERTATPSYAAALTAIRSELDRICGAGHPFVVHRDERGEIAINRMPTPPTYDRIGLCMVLNEKETLAELAKVETGAGVDAAWDAI